MQRPATKTRRLTARATRTSWTHAALLGALALVFGCAGSKNSAGSGGQAGSTSGGSSTGGNGAGYPAAGGRSGVGGAGSAGSGAQPLGGNSAETGGASAQANTGGSSFTGGVGAGGRADGGGRSSGGAANQGGHAGNSATGGANGGASTQSGAGGVSADRCDVGVYDASAPPKALSLSGNLGAHDPSAIESGDTYYLFATGLGAKTSSNLTSWSAAAAPFAAPAWLKTAVPGVTDLWAPDIAYFGDTYHLYYAGSTFGSNRSCIGYATRAALDAGSWTDRGQVICSNTSDDWNAIDPNVVLDQGGKPWLVLGSFWSGIKLIELDANGARVGTDLIALADRPSARGALEGPVMVRRCGYYYLFTSWDTCCKGADSTYNIRVVRSASLSGPFADKAGTSALKGGGTLIAQGDTTWAGPGGQSVLFSGKKAYLVYHAYAKRDGAPTLRIAELVWDEAGWPVPVGP